MGCDFGKNTKDSLICTIDKKDCIYYLPSVGKCYEERHTFYQQYIKLQNQQMQWISVKDKLPEKYKTVIVTYDDGIVYISHLTIDSYSELVWEFPAGFVPLNVVTHWMELPQKPKDSD